jgi:hypothetical protein
MQYLRISSRDAQTASQIKEKEMTIRENILNVKRRILEDVVNENKEFSIHLQNLSLAAILKGPTSEEWETYMKTFADPAKPGQLERLMGRDGTGNREDLNRARAYLVADAPCTPFTALNFGNFTSTLLDDGLVEEPVNPQPGPQ